MNVQDSSRCLTREASKRQSRILRWLTPSRPLALTTLTIFVLLLGSVTGAIEASSIGDLVWNDLDADGTRDPGEPGVDGVTLVLYSDTSGDGVLDPTDTRLSTARTSGGGTFDFTSLSGGTYFLALTDLDGVLEGFRSTTGSSVQTVALGGAQDYNDADFGYYDPAPASNPGTCYAVSEGVEIVKGGNDRDALASLNRDGSGIKFLGFLTTGESESAAFRPHTNTLYSVNEDQLGTVDPAPPSFNSTLSDVHRCNARDASGGVKEIRVDDLDSLAFHPLSGELWAVERDGVAPSTGSLAGTDTHEFLMRLDPETGSMVPNQFGPGIACQEISSPATDHRDIDDLVIDTDGTFYAVINNSPTVGLNDTLVSLDPATGIASVIGSFGYDDIEALGVGSDGTVYASSGFDTLNPMTFFTIDTTTGTANLTFGGLSNMQFPAIPEANDFEGVGCLTDGLNAIQGTVYFDTDHDLTLDTEELGAIGVSIELYVDKNANGIVDGADALGATTVTQGDGSYSFAIAAEGDFVLQVDASTLPAGSAFQAGEDNVEIAAFTDVGNTDSSNDFALTWPSSSALSVTKVSDAAGAVVPGQTLTYTVVIENTASHPVTGIRILDALPTGTSYVTGSTSVTGPLDQPEEYYQDDFSSWSYSGGTQPGGSTWSTPWVDRDNDGLGPSSGNILLVNTATDSRCVFADPCLKIEDEDLPGTPDFIYREADLSAYQRATLTFDINNRLDNGAVVTFEASPNGGSTYSPLETYSVVNHGVHHEQFDLTPYLAANTRIRFRATMFVNNEYLYVDNLVISGTRTVSTTVTNDGGAGPQLVDGTPSSLALAADGFSLSPAGTANDTLTLTYQVQVNDPLDAGIHQIFNLAAVSSNEAAASFAWVLDPVLVPGSIGDRVWFDQDGDGLQDVGEPGLGDVRVELYDGTSSLIDALTTDHNGNYHFATLAPGTYEVRVVEGTLPGGSADLILTDGSTNPRAGVNLTSGEQLLNIDFGYRPAPGTSAAGDYVWSDADNDGIHDAGEVGIAGVSVALLDATSGATLATETTASDGRYWFTGLADGEYRVRVTDTAAVLAGFSVTQGPHSPGASVSAPFQLEAPQVRGDLDFGYYNANLSNISDRVWLDMDGDGIFDPEEAGVGEVSASLLNSSGELVATTTTRLDGSLGFSGMPDGTYTIDITDTSGQLVGYRGTSNEARAHSVQTVVAGSPTLVSGTHFGYRPAGVLGDLLYLDADGDGARAPNEMGIGGVTIELRDPSDNSVIAATSTGADGLYRFALLPPGDFEVVVTDTGNVLAALTQTGDPDSTLDGTGTATLWVGESSLDLDFGYQDSSPAGISGTVFEDLDRDGVQDAGETGISAVTVALLDATGAVVATTASALDGSYSFPSLLDGSYTVLVTDLDDVLDGSTLTHGLDARPVTIAGSSVGNVDFGYARTSATAGVGDRVWFDANRDGIEGGAESGLQGIGLELWEDSDGDDVRSGGDTLVATTTTSLTGGYLFGGLPAGRYLVDVDEGTLPAGFSETTATGGVSSLISLAEGESFLAADFGYALASGSAIGDTVFLDADGAGYQDPGEPGIGGVQLTVTGPGGYNQTVTTASDGSWLVTGVTVSGDYLVAVNTLTLPAGLNPVSTTYGTSTQDFPVVAGTDLLFADFGFTELAAGTLGSIGDLVFLDLNADGTQGPGELGIGGITLDLLNAAAEVIATTTTDANGSYSFSGLLAGSYQVAVTDLHGSLAALNLTAGTDPTPAIALASGQVYELADFGYAPSSGVGSIGNHVWHDRNGNGVADATESGVEGVTLQLWLDSNSNGTIEPGLDNLVRNATTDQNGEYFFTSLAPGNYLVNVADAAAVLQGFAKSAGAAGVDGNSQANPYDVGLTVASANNQTADFGYSAGGTPYAATGVVFFDNDGDGLRNQPLESGIGGVTLFLFRDLDSDGALDLEDVAFGSTVSAADGSYSFTNLPDTSAWIVVADTTGTFLEGAFQTTQSGTLGVEPFSLAGANRTGLDFGYTKPPTYALVTGFHAYPNGVVEWTTTTEVGTLGFLAWRWDQQASDWEPITETLVPSDPRALAGARYSIEGPAPGDDETYLLAEVEVGGARTYHGPYTRSPREEETVPAGHPGVKALPIPNRTPAAKVGPPPENDSSGEPARALRLGVANDGLIRVPSAEIAALSGLNIEDVRRRFLRHSYRLRLGSSEVPWAAASGDLVFLGRANATPYDEESTYWLEPGRGLAAKGTSGSPQDEPGTEFVRGATRFEKNLFAATAVSPDPDTDYWFWKVLSAGHPSVGSSTLPFELLETVAGDATLEITLFAATESPADVDHTLRISVNGVIVGDTLLGGSGRHSLNLQLPSGLLETGSNELRIEALLPEGVESSVLYLDHFEVEYLHFARARNGRIAFWSSEGETVTIDGLESPEVVVFGETTLSGVVAVKDVLVQRVGETYAATFEIPEAGKYFVSELEALQTPTIQPVQGRSLRAEREGADYVIVTTRDLLTPARDLAALRQGQGRKPIVVDIQDVYDSFSAGSRDPAAIRSFLAFAWERWETPPDAVALAGSGSFDYRNHLGRGGNLIPPTMVQTPGGLYASDSTLGDVVGTDGAPEIAVGRIPVQTAEEFDWYIEKLEAYESSGEAAGDRKVLFLADNADGAGDFGSDSERVASYLPAHITRQQLSLDRQSLTDVRSSLFEAVERGTLLINYLGHGGLDRLAAEGILTKQDAMALQTSGRVPIVSALTCSAGRFEVPGIRSLAETLVLERDGGAVAMWAPSGLSFGQAGRELDEHFTDALFRGGFESLGEVILESQRRFASSGHFPHMMRIYNLIGDPALRLPEITNSSSPLLFADGFESGGLDRWQ